MAKITLIGSGKTATALGKSLQAGGHKIMQVWSRREEAANELAKKIHAAPVTDLTAIHTDADIYIIAVKDDAIAEVAKQLRIGNKIVAHTSGIKSKDLLKTVGMNYGIFYPFVSMTKEADTDFTIALMMIEGSNDQTTEVLYSLAQTLSNNVKMVEERQRQSMHLAAVFAHNFTNHMYTIAEKILEEKGLKFDDLRPLIAAHIANLQKLPPSTLQTGPAIRHDSSTMTDAIQKWYKERK
jgi:predicted short-subunit dehydrogenase-like oxidoreductase (DUF2520 family)